MRLIESDSISVNGPTLVITSTLASCLLLRPDNPNITLGPLNSITSNPVKPAIS